MRKYVFILVALVFTAVLAGCGTSKTTATSVSGINPVKLDSTNFGTSLSMAIKSLKVGEADIVLMRTGSTDTSGTVSGALTGTWQLTDITLPRGPKQGEIIQGIKITETVSSTTHDYACIQIESGYLLVYNSKTNPGGVTKTDTATDQISRLYLDSSASFDPTLMGGSKQGTPLNLTAPTAVNVTTFAGSTAGTSGSTDTTSVTAATFSRPMGITTDGTNFYVTDYLNNVIRKIDSAGKVTTIAGSAGIAGLSDSTDKTGKTAFFNQPNGITIVGNLLYVVDSGNHMIRSVNKDTGETLRIAGTAGIAGNNDTSGGSPAFNSPIGITTDGTNLYVADSGNNTIRKIVILTGVVSTIAGNVAGPGSVDGISTAALFNLPTRLTTDGSFLYVTDFNNRTLRKVVIATGVVSTLAGNPNASAASIDTNTAANISATFYHLGGITTDGTDLYITEYNDTIESSPNWISLVRKVVISADGTTATVTTIAGGSVPVAVPTATQIVDDPVGTGGRARFVNPVGITTNGSGLYVTDGGFNNIRLLQKL